LIATLTAVLGFSVSEVATMTIGQAIRYAQVLPNVLPYINPYASKPEKKLTGEAATAALRAFGVKEAN